MSRVSLSGFAALTLVACTALPAIADFTGPDGYGWTRGSADSAYFEWDFFTDASGGNAPDVGQFPAPLPDGWAAPDVAETTGEGIVTGSGNIYSPFAVLDFDVTVPNYGLRAGGTTLLLQTRTLGTEWDYTGVNLAGAAPTQIIELERVALGDFGFQVDTLFVFEVEGNAEAYVFNLPAAESSLSLDRVAVDTFVADPCIADFNEDGAVNTQDVIAYLNAWSAKSQSADINGDGTVNTQDFIAYLNLWAAGC